MCAFSPLEIGYRRRGSLVTRIFLPQTPFFQFNPLTVEVDIYPDFNWAKLACLSNTTSLDLLPENVQVYLSCVDTEDEPWVIKYFMQNSYLKVPKWIKSVYLNNPPVQCSLLYCANPAEDRTIFQLLIGAYLLLEQKISESNSNYKNISWSSELRPLWGFQVLRFCDPKSLWLFWWSSMSFESGLKSCKITRLKEPYFQIWVSKLGSRWAFG